MMTDEAPLPANDDRPRSSRISAPDNEPDALAILKEDHERVKRLFREALSADAGAIGKQRATIDEIVRELELHAKLEETIFYPALRARTKASDEERQEVLEALEEHGAVKDLIKKIKRSTGRDETLKAKVQVLSELVEHHVREEEDEMFGDARRLLGERRLRKIGAEIARAKAGAAGKRGSVNVPKRRSALAEKRPAAIVKIGAKGTADQKHRTSRKKT